MTAKRNIEELYPRAPRYVIQISDDHIVRFAHQPKGSRAMHTRIVDLSESGMAFVVPVLSAPKLDEKIKVEFNAPGCDPIACFAKVVRVQHHKSYNSIGQPQVFRLIAVEFQNLYEAQRQQIAQGLTEQFKRQQKSYARKQFFLKVQWYLTSVFYFLGSLFRNIGKLLRFKKAKAQRNDKYIND